MQFFYVCELVVSDVAFVFSLFIPHSSSLMPREGCTVIAVFSLFFVVVFFCNSKVQKKIRKNAYSNILKISLPKLKFSDKINLTFFIFLLKIDCGYALEPPREAVLTSTHNLSF